MTDLLFKVPEPSDDFQQESIERIIREMKDPDLANTWSLTVLRKALTHMCKGEFVESLTWIHRVDKQGSDGCFLTVDGLGAEVFENSWDLLEAITPETSPCEYCGEESDKTGLVFLNNMVNTEIDIFWDVLYRQVKTGPGRNDYKSERVEIVCEGCFCDLKEIADKMDAIELRISDKYEMLYGSPDECGETFPLDGEIGEAFWNERYAEWKPLLAQISKPWKFREES